jgi:hypothetical protein
LNEINNQSKVCVRVCVRFVCLVCW